MLLVNMVASTINVLTGAEPKAIVGLPIVFVILIYLSRRSTREFFAM
jgi:hypothetical protein